MKKSKGNKKIHLVKVPVSLRACAQSKMAREGIAL